MMTVPLLIPLRCVPDAKWSDGQKVTAGDFEYSWKRLANPQTAADYYLHDRYGKRLSGNCRMAQIQIHLAVKAIDDDTLEITLKL